MLCSSKTFLIFLHLPPLSGLGFLEFFYDKAHHEHIFFEDEKGGNIGFTTSGISDVIDSHFSEMTGLFYEKTKTFGKFFTETDPNVIAKYRETDGKHYDDAIMRKAVEDVKKSGKFYYYKALGNGRNNCQDFVQDVKDKYYEILKQQERKK